MKIKSVALVLFALISSQVFANLDDSDRFNFYLHTINTGDLVYSSYGHTTIRVVDSKNKSDTVYNWGMFEGLEEDPVTFVLNFYKGFLLYKLAIYSIHTSHEIYKHDRRTVWQDKINFTPSQKKALLKKLSWAKRPENRAYQYHYFFDNCSTRPRDYIDDALGGKIKKHSSNIMTGETFRDMALEHNKINFGIDFGLDIIMNDRVDRTMTLWEKMFLPLTLRQVLSETASDLVDENGNNKPLLTDSKILHDFEQAKPSSMSSHSLYLIFTLGIMLSCLALFYFHKQKFAYFFLGLFSIIYGIFAGLLGILMPLSWVLSGHLDFHHNANIILFWPIDLFLILLGFQWLFKRRALKLSPSNYNLSRLFWLCHILSAIALPVLYFVGIINQNVALISIYILPSTLLYFLLCYRFGFRLKA